jgi:predicted PurR-regulated permease PerM
VLQWRHGEHISEYFWWLFWSRRQQFIGIRVQQLVKWIIQWQQWRSQFKQLIRNRIQQLIRNRVQQLIRNRVQQFLRWIIQRVYRWWGSPCADSYWAGLRYQRRR